MHSFCLALGALTGALGFALLFAGFLSLAGADAAERAALRQRYAAARAQGGAWSEYLEYTRARSEFTSLSRLATEWPRRTGARRMICFGFAAMIIAVLAWVAASYWFQATPTPNHAIRRTASRAAIYAVSVCHPPVHCESRFTGLAVADLVSR